MWSRENRGLYERKSAGYQSDLSDAEWAPIAPLSHGGRSEQAFRALFRCMSRLSAYCGTVVAG